MNVILKNNNLEVSNNNLTLVVNNITTVQLEFNYSVIKDDKSVVTGECKSNGIFGNLKPLSLNANSISSLDDLSQLIKDIKPMFNVISKSNDFQNRYSIGFSQSVVSAD